MINLLPQHEKKKLLKEFRLRFVVLALLTLLLLEVIMFVSFIPSYYSLTAATSDLETSLAFKKKQAPPGSDATQNDLNTIKNEIALLKFGNETLPSDIMTTVFAAKPQGVNVSRFTYGHSASAISVQLSGVAGTREDLLLFERLLRNSPLFSNVSHAQNFITKRTDIEFQLTLSLK